MKPEPTAINKIARPALPKVFPRPRLLRLLDQTCSYPITWISGPPGSGKTTLIADYLDRKKFPCLWYQMDESDVDLAGFFYYLGLAAEKSTRRIKKPLPLLTAEYQLAVPTFARRFFENLFNRMKLNQIMVFDNYQAIPFDSPFHEIIRHGLNTAPPGARVIIISRSTPPPALMRFQANGLLEIIDWEKMRLTPKELTGILKLHNKKSPGQQVIRYLQEKTQGWAAGVILLKNLREEATGTFIRDHHMPEAIFDYFAGEIFNRMNPESQEFLLKTACLRRMTPRMAEQLTGIAQAGRILADLNRMNYFIEKRSHPELSYQYHALFREFLLNRLAERTASPETVHKLFAAAAGILEESGDVEDAVELYCQARAWNPLENLIRQHGPTLISQGRFATLEKWLATVPDEVMNAEPWLAYWNGECKSYSAPQKSQDFYEQAYRQFRARGDAAGVCLAWVGVMDVIAYAFEDLTQYDQWIPLLDDVLREFGQFPSRDIEGRAANAMLTALVLRRPDHPAFPAWMEKALVYEKRKINTLFELAFLYIYRGDYGNARRFKDELQDIGNSIKANPLSLVTIKLYDTIFYALTGSPEQCIRAADAGLELADKTGMHILDIMLLGNGAFAAYQSGDLRTARKFFARLISVSGQSRPWEPACFHFTAVVDALLTKNLPKARHHAELNLKYATRVGVRVLEVYSHFLNAVVLNEQGEYAEAETLLEQGLLISKTFRSDVQQFEYLLIRAHFNLSRRQNQTGFDFLKRALAFGNEKGIFGFYLTFNRRILTDLCIKALEAEIEVEYVRELIRKWRLLPETVPLHIEAWPWPIKIRTLGRFEIEQAGRPLQFSKKAPKKLLETLKALIAAGGKELSTANLADMLWPDADGDLAGQSLATALKRLRLLLGHKDALQVHESRVCLNPRYCWVDAWAFEHLLAKAEKVQDIAADFKLLEQALNLYQGLFLPHDSEQAWVLPMRERLKNKYTRALTRLGLHWEQAGDLPQAATCYQKGLELDALAEEFLLGRLKHNPGLKIRFVTRFSASSTRTPTH